MAAQKRTDLRNSIGSTKYGIEAHEAPIEDFPKQPSQKDGLGRMCKPPWHAYTNALRKVALARKAVQGEAVPTELEPVGEPEVPAPRRSRRAKVHAEPEVAEAAAE